MSSVPIIQAESARPDIYKYHDYKLFLKDHLVFLKETEPGFSFRKLARAANIATGYLSTILNSDQSLSEKALEKILPHLGLTSAEKSYLRQIYMIVRSDSQIQRFEALRRLHKFRTYQQLNPKEMEVAQYFTNWHYVAIREMAGLPDFRLDPEWIQKRLRFSVSLAEITKAVHFLLDKGFLERTADGNVKIPDRIISCNGDVYRIALTQFHKQIFELAAASMENTPRELRNISGHTFSISKKNFEKIRLVLGRALEEIAKEGQDDRNPDSVYHFSFLGFPLTKEDEEQSK